MKIYYLSVMRGTHIFILCIFVFIASRTINNTCAQISLSSACSNCLRFEKAKTIDSIPDAVSQRLKDSINVDSLNRIRDLRIIKEVIQARVNNGNRLFKTSIL